MDRIKAERKEAKKVKVVPLTQEEDLILQKLVQACEKAFHQGLTHSEIFSVLVSPEVLKVSSIDNDGDLQVKRKRVKNVKGQSWPWTLGTRRKLLGILITLIISILIWPLLGSSTERLSTFIQEQKCIIPMHQVLKELFRPIANCSICSGNGRNGEGSPVIEFLRPPTTTEFSHVAYSSKPIIVRGGAFASAMPSDFNFQTLKEIFESEPDGVDTVSEECQFLPFRSSFLSLRHAFGLISTSDSWDQPWYIGWSNCHPGVAAKLRALFPRPSFLPSESESSLIDWVFVGSPGHGAAMHIDYVRRPSWQAQLSGTKKWTLRPVPECEGSCIPLTEFTIFPGDMLFLETNFWYHETFIEGSDLSISIGSEYD